MDLGFPYFTYFAVEYLLIRKELSFKVIAHILYGGRFISGVYWYVTCYAFALILLNALLLHFTDNQIKIYFFPLKCCLFWGPSVAVFLFISGYSEAFQLFNKKNYYDQFLTRKICRIYIPWLISVILFAFMFQISDLKVIGEGLLCFRTIYRDDTLNWFVIAILYFYLALFIYGQIAKRGHRECKKSFFLSFIFVVSLIWLLGCFLAGVPIHWYGNSFTFMFGCVFGIYHKEIRQRVGSKILLCIVVATVTSAALVAASAITDLYSVNLACRLSSTASISILTWALAQYYTNGGEGLKFLGNLSLEIFFLGTGFFVWYYTYFEANSVSILFVILAVVAAAFVLNRISGFLTDFIRKCINKFRSTK